MRGLQEIQSINNNRETYRIVRFYKNGERQVLEQMQGLSLGVAQAHCNDRAMRSDDWFDGYEVEA
jgi:hypothetical protein